MEDLELLEQFSQTHSEEAFEILVSRHVNLVYSVALRKTGNPEAAREITQAVFLVLSQKAASLNKKTILAAWLHETARLTSSHYYRDETRRLHREQEACMQFLSNKTAQETWSQLEPHLDDAINDLSQKDREAIVIRFFENKSLAELGKVQGISEDAAQKRVSRALDKIRSYFIRRKIALPSMALGAVLTANSIQAAPSGLVAATVAAITTNGSMAGGTVFALSKGVIKTMALTKLKISASLGVAVLLAASSSVLVWQEVVSITRSNSTTFARSNSSHSIASSTQAPLLKNAPTFSWSNIESTDYRQYANNLRKAGFPEEMVRDIVLADLHQLYRKEIQKIYGNHSPLLYWKKNYNTTYSDTEKKITALFKKESAVAQSILGYPVDMNKFIEPVWLGGDDISSTFGWLPQEKCEAAKKLINESDLDDSDDNYSEKFKKITKLLSTILTPEEIEEYRLRESSQGQRLRQYSYYANPTPEEFKALFKVRESIKDCQDESFSLLQKEIDGLTQTLGSDRAIELAKECDRTYFWANVAAERYGIPSQSIDQAVKLKWDTMKQSEQIWSDTTLAEPQRQQQLASLKESVMNSLVQCLGANGAKFAEYDSIWLRNITSKP